MNTLIKPGLFLSLILMMVSACANASGGIALGATRVIYPADAKQTSLAITNSSSSLFTLKVMSVVSLLIPFVAAYIWYAWRALTRPISEREVEEAEHKY